MLQVIFFCFFCLNALVAVGGVQSTTKPPPTEDHPEIAVIQVDGAPKCLGAFVATPEEPKSRFIATAAHCIYGVKASRLGFKSVKMEPEVKKVKRVMVHPYYLPPSFDYDIALLKTDKAGDSQPGFLLNKDVHLSSDLKAVVWEQNKTAAAPLEDRESCRKKMANRIVVSSRMLCAHTPPNYVIDGSPLFNVSNTKNTNTKHIFGVGSYSPTGGSQGTPKIFTNIANSEIYSFINKYID